MEASESPSAKWLWKEKSTAAVLVFLGSTRVGCVNARRKPPWEDGVGSGDEGGKTARARQSSSFFCLFLCRGREDRLFFALSGGSWW